MSRPSGREAYLTLPAHLTRGADCQDLLEMLEYIFDWG